MIKDFEGKRITAKQKAALLTWDALNTLAEGYWAEEDKYTEAEVEQITKYLDQYKQRIEKILDSALTKIGV